MPCTPTQTAKIPIGPLSTPIGSCTTRRCRNSSAAAPVRSHLTAELVALDERFTKTHPKADWERFYAQDLIERFAA